MEQTKHIIIYTDGCSLGNPGPGGWAAVLNYRGKRKEISGGVRLTTNNRMELTAVIEALKAIKTNRKYKIVINTDSKLIVSAFNQGWLEKWEKKNWYRNRKDKVINSDLWIKATELVKIHEVEFRWVPGHAGIEENERCDQLANIAAQQPGLPADAIYEKEKESDIFVGDDSM